MEQVSGGGPARVPPLLLAPETRGALRAVSFSLVALLVVTVLRLSYPGIPDPDSFYHFRHAALYAQRGLTMSAFPWLVYSIISQFSSDIGYGFHLLLVPFTFLRDPILGVKLGAVFETAAVMIIFYAVMRRHRIAFAFAWPFVLVFLAPPIVYTVLQTRPQTLTMGFSALLLSFLLVGSGWGVFLGSFLISFVHLNIVLIVPILVAVAALAQGLSERRWEWRKWVLTVAGIGGGWLLRPNPLGAARLEYVQVIAHELVRRNKIPLLFGREWEPVSGSALASFSYFLFLWGAIAAIFLMALAMRRHDLTPRDRTFLWSSFLLSLIFFIGAVAITKRAVPLWATFAVMFVAQTFTCFLDPLAKSSRPFVKEETRLVLALCAAAISLAMVWDGVKEPMMRGKWPSTDPYRFQAAADWLKQHAPADAIVFNVNWDDFPELFFWNWEDRYVSGLDPMFLFAYNQALYWKAHHLQTGEGVDHTWGTMTYQAGREEDTYTALRHDFRASYLVLIRQRNGGLYEYLRDRPGVTLGFDEGGIAVFALG